MAIIVMVLVKAETKWLGTKKTFEWFSTAGRNVKSGLIASSVVSAWTCCNVTSILYSHI
jgi:Na+/proline symporter